MATRQAPGGQPGAPADAAAGNRFRGVVRAGRKKPARARKIRRNKDFIEPDQTERQANGKVGSPDILKPAVEEHAVISLEDPVMLASRNLGRGYH